MYLAASFNSHVKSPSSITTLRNLAYIKSLQPCVPLQLRTNSNIPVTRRMKLVPNPELYIPNVLTALSTVFPGCNSTLVKVITSQRGDKEQLLHTDFDLKYIISRVFNLDSFHYSAIIALQPDTHLLVRGKRERIDISVNSRWCLQKSNSQQGDKNINSSLCLVVWKILVCFK